MRLWITGAKGLVARALAQQIPFPVELSGKEVDIADLEALRTFSQMKGPFTHIVNCAACSQVDFAETHSEAAFRANAMGPANLGLIAREMKAKLLHLSTDYVFSGEGHLPWTEQSPTKPCNVYGASKLAGEQQLMAVLPSCCILRTSWVFGPAELGGKNFVTKLLTVLQTEEELQLSSDQISRPTYVVDLAKTIIAMLNVSGLYHFANADAMSKYEFARLLQKKAQERGLPIKCQTIIPVLASSFAQAAKRPLYTPLDTAKIEQVLSVSPRKIADCLEDYIHAL